MIYIFLEGFPNVQQKVSLFLHLLKHTVVLIEVKPILVNVFIVCQFRELVSARLIYIPRATMAFVWTCDYLMNASTMLTVISILLTLRELFVFLAATC